MCKDLLAMGESAYIQGSFDSIPSLVIFGCYRKPQGSPAQQGTCCTGAKGCGQVGRTRARVMRCFWGLGCCNRSRPVKSEACAGGSEKGGAEARKKSNERGERMQPWQALLQCLFVEGGGKRK